MKQTTSYLHGLWNRTAFKDLLVQKPARRHYPFGASSALNCSLPRKQHIPALKPGILQPREFKCLVCTETMQQNQRSGLFGVFFNK